MKKSISIIVPAYNEEKNIEALVERIHAAFKGKKDSYEIIFVDDNSTDKSQSLIKKLTERYPVRLHIKQGKPGKAYSIREGADLAKYSAIAMIDADLQYPPEAIPLMLEALTKSDIVVASRRNYQDSSVRRVLSRTFRNVFGKSMFGLAHDIQSGLKVFTREVFQTIKFAPSSAWTFDLEFLHRSYQAGFTISDFDITFAPRKKGDSKMSVFKQTFEIGMNALKVRSKKINPVAIAPKNEHSMVGAGVGFKKKKYITHTTIPHNLLALKTITASQKAFIVIGFLALALALFIKPLLTLQIIVAALSSIYFIDVIFNLYLVTRSLVGASEIKASNKDLTSLQTKDLPIYTILCPLYREAHVIPQFLSAIEKIDWPKSKLDVILLLEEDDQVSVDAVHKMNLPSYVRMLVVPDSAPKTKPKACNYGLAHARGEYLVIYDAEDVPDPLQLKKAYLGFKKVKKDVICLQAKLNYYNPHQNLLTRFFTAEYSLWFDITLTGLQSLSTTIPLGGTSNHFKMESLIEVAGWDPFNVTEDADLGIRLFKKGYKTEIIDSTTLEEANSQLGNWIRQRSRWIKGYMQTYLVHTRPGYREKSRVHSLIFQLLIGGKIAFVLINPLLWIATIAYFALYAYVGPAIEALYPSIVFYMAVFSLVFGNFFFLYCYMIGVAKRSQWNLMKFVFLIPFYWLAISWAACIALYQLILKPHYWEKTIHGLHLIDIAEKKPFPTLSFPRISFPAGVFNFGFVTSYAKYLSGIIYVAGIALGGFLNFVYSAYLGRVLSFADFGLLAWIGGLASIVAILAGSVGTTVNFRTGFLIGKNGEEAAYKFWRQVRRKTLFLTFIFSVLWVVLAPVLASYFKLESILPLIVFAPVILLGFVGSIDRGLAASRLMFVTLGIVNVLEPLVKLGIAVGLVYTGHASLAYTAIPISTLAIFLFGWALVNRRVEKESRIVSASKFPWSFLIASLFSGVSSLLLLNMDVILAKHYLDASEAGQYALVSLVGKMVFFLGALATPFTIPLVARNEGARQDSKKILNLTILATFILTLGGAVAFGLLGYITVPLLFGSKALPIVTLLPFICFSMMGYTLSKVFVDYYLVKRYYGFAAAALSLGILELFLVSKFHDSYLTMILVMGVLWTTNLVVMVCLHFGIRYLMVFENNVRAAVRLFARHEVARGKVKVLIFNWRDTKHKWAGGAEVYLHELSKRLVEDGASVTLFCGNGTRRPENETIEGVQIVRRGGFYTVYVWAFLYYMLKFRGKYDIIIDSENGIPFFTPLYAKENKFLLIHHVHQEVFRKSLRWPLSTIASTLEGKFMPAVYKNTPVLTVSPSSKDEIIRHKLTKLEPTIIYNGVDLSKFRPSKKSANPLILYVGRLQYYKSLNVFLKAAKKILETVPAAEFIIAGEGGQKEKLIKFATKLGVSKKVKFLGFVTNEKKIELLQKAWVFVNPSFMEGWGITTIEAAACGTPTVASNVPGLWDSIKNNETGFLVKYADSDAFAKKITKLLENKKIRVAMSRESIMWARNFSWEKSSHLLERLIERSLSETKILVGELALLKNEK